MGIETNSIGMKSQDNNYHINLKTGGDSDTSFIPVFSAGTAESTTDDDTVFSQLAKAEFSAIEITDAKDAIDDAIDDAIYVNKAYIHVESDLRSTRTTDDEPDDPVKGRCAITTTGGIYSHHHVTARQSLSAGYGNFLVDGTTGSVTTTGIVSIKNEAWPAYIPLGQDTERLRKNQWNIRNKNSTSDLRFQFQDDDEPANTNLNAVVFSKLGGISARTLHLKAALVTKENDAWDYDTQTGSSVGREFDPIEQDHNRRLELEMGNKTQGIIRCINDTEDVSNGRTNIMMDSDSHMIYFYKTSNPNETNGVIMNLDDGKITAKKIKAEVVSDFTGQHCCSSDTIVYSDDNVGYIVSTGTNYTRKTLSKNKINNITINTSIPLVDITIKKNDKKVFGVISNTSENEKKISINSLGEGAVWVSDFNGPLESGDYITSSDIPGIGQRQDAEMLMNYTVAKITMDCNFDPLIESSMIFNEETDVYEQKLNNQGNPIYLPEYNMKYIKLDGTVVQKAEYDTLKAQGKKVFRMAFVGCTYHCG